MADKIQKKLAAHGVASRRKIEAMIAAGRIHINGELASIGRRVEDSDTVVVDGEVIKFAPQDTVLLMYHKPAGEICSHQDPEGRPTIYDSLPAPPQGRWVSIGRLDFNTQGLLLLTNDGELANKWMHPSANLEREYLVRVRGHVSDLHLERLLSGIELEDGFAQCKVAKRVSPDPTKQNQWVRLVITEGRNREVRRLMEACDLTVSQLKRIRFGHLCLPKTLPAGQLLRIKPEDHCPR